MIFNEYNKYLKKISVPKKITNNEVLEGSCYNFLIYHKNVKYIRNELIKLNYDTGVLLYENLNKSRILNNKKNKTKNLDNLSQNLLVLPTHTLITKSYAQDLAKTTNRIVRDKI